ncbi:MAG: hypothetical protein MJZ58_02170 [Paludibacteraceae bacterium]|nr:hypothetical protein [Paludibacteraceae bacterium]
MKKSILLFAATLFAAATFAQTPTVSASSVTFKYCESTSSAISITIPAGLLPYIWNGEYIDEFGTSVHTLVNARGCDSIVAVTLNDAKGAIPFAFSISADKQVYFSQGPLQYCAAPTSGETTHKVATPVNSFQQGIFRFAEHQYDFVGNAEKGNVYANGKKCNNLKFASDYNGWIDMFCFGASGYENKYPYVENDYKSIDTYSDLNYNSNDKYYDWGVFNAISNGGNVPEKWFVLNDDQWKYLLETRVDAAKKVAYATVAGYSGTVLLPDEWVLPQGLSFDPEEGASVNVYTAEQWKLMEANGAIFFNHEGGYLQRSNSINYSCYCYPYSWYSGTAYWISSNATGNGPNNSTYAGSKSISSLLPYHKASVRLVRYTTTTF